MKLNTYIILDRAIREAVLVGFTQAMRDEDINNNPEKLVDYMGDTIMSELSNIIIFDDLTKEDPITIDPRLMEELQQLQVELENEKKEKK